MSLFRRQRFIVYNQLLIQSIIGFTSIILIVPNLLSSLDEQQKET